MLKTVSIGIVNINTLHKFQLSSVKQDSEKHLKEQITNFLETQYCEGDAAKAQTIAENYITQGVVGIFGCKRRSIHTGAGNAIKASGSDEIIGVGFDKSDAI